MPTLIYTDQPSTGKSIQIAKANIGTEYEDLLSAPLFSIPRTSSELAEDYIDLSRVGEEREFILGEVFINAPLICNNKSDFAVEVIVRMLVGGLDTTNFIQLTPAIVIPKKDGVRINIQGQTLLLKDPRYTYGDTLQIKASVENTVDVFGAATESAAATHAPDSENF